MVAVASTVIQQQGRVSIISYKHIRETVVVEVCERHASPDVWCLESAAGALRRLRKLAVAFIVEQRVDLLEVDVRRDLFHLRINVPVGDKRSEERRVGKECRSRWWRDDEKVKERK